MDLTGGRVTRDTSDTVTGIFIKSVLADSPAGRTGQLATGDRIVEVIQYSVFIQWLENFLFTHACMHDIRTHFPHPHILPPG